MRHILDSFGDPVVNSIVNSIMEPIEEPVVDPMREQAYAARFGREVLGPAVCGFTLWLCVTDTFGLPFSDYLFPDKRGAMRDTLVRIPWAKMRPHTLTGGRDYEED